MGFDINFNKKPIIKGAQNTQDGGAGNLGYFNSRKKNEKENADRSVFVESEDSDTFEKDKGDSLENEDDFSIANLIAKFILAIKDLFRKLFK